MLINKHPLDTLQLNKQEVIFVLYYTYPEACSNAQ